MKDAEWLFFVRKSITGSLTIFYFFFCCHLPGTCHSPSKHSWKIHVFHYGNLRNSIIQRMRKHSLDTWPALWNENSPSDFLCPFFFFSFHKHAPCSALLGYICCLLCKSFIQETHYFLSILSSSVLLLETATRSGAEGLWGRVRIV